jgi:cyclophilin family peptidyl-prolyl cis-trans isomerase
MSDPRSPGTRNTPLLIGAAVVLVAAVVAIAAAVNAANNATPVAVSTPTPLPTPTARPTPTPLALIPYADCSTATFGPALAPLNPPASVHAYPAAPATTIDSTKLYQATITTAKGQIVLCLQPDLAPNTVNNFVTLARNHFYDGIPFHRVVASFVDQGGDPNCIGHVPPPPATPPASCGQGGPGFAFNDEPVHQKYVDGCVAMANSGRNTNGSQFFICIADDSASLQSLYNLFGKVYTGMDVALRIVQGDVMQTVTVRQQQ